MTVKIEWPTNNYILQRMRKVLKQARKEAGMDHRYHEMDDEESKIENIGKKLGISHQQVINDTYIAVYKMAVIAELLGTSLIDLLCEHNEDQQKMENIVNIHKEKHLQITNAFTPIDKFFSGILFRNDNSQMHVKNLK